MFNSVAVANKFIQLAGYENRLLTQMQLHKLVFFAHALALASQDTPLIRGAFIATQYGPVEAELWEFTKSYGPDPMLLI